MVIAGDAMIGERLIDVMIMIGQGLIEQDVLVLIAVHMLVLIAVHILSAIESIINLSDEALIVNLAEATLMLTVIMLLPCVILWAFSLGVELELLTMKTTDRCE